MPSSEKVPTTLLHFPVLLLRQESKSPTEQGYPGSRTDRASPSSDFKGSSSRIHCPPSHPTCPDVHYPSGLGVPSWPVLDGTNPSPGASPIRGRQQGRVEAVGCVLGRWLLCVAVRAGSPVQGTATAGVGGEHILQEVIRGCATPCPTPSSPYHWVLAGLGPLGALLLLVIKQLGQEVDVLHSQAKDLVLAELLVWGMRGNQLAQFGKRPIHILLPPSLPAVGEDSPHNFGVGTWRLEGTGQENGQILPVTPHPLGHWGDLSFTQRTPTQSLNPGHKSPSVNSPPVTSYLLSTTPVKSHPRPCYPLVSSTWLLLCVYMAALWLCGI